LGPAEVLDTPFPAKVLWMKWRADRCGPNDCQIVSYRIQVTNPTERDVNVAECTLVATSVGNEPISLGIVIGFPAGTWVPAGKTRSAGGMRVVRARKVANLDRLRDGTITCTGWDWHGHPPP
jgi:hypothetical protein